MRIVFRHLEGSKKGKEEAFEKSRIRAGRDPSNDLAFDPFRDRDASGFHAEIYFEDSGWWVKDLGSTNGTFVNDERADVRKIGRDDVVSFGKHGPRVAVNWTDGADAAQAAAPGVLPAREGVENVGTNTMRLMVRQAMEKARGKGGVAGGTMFLREMVRQTVVETTARQKKTMAVLAVLLASAAVIIGIQFYFSWRSQKQHEEEIEQHLRGIRDREENLLRQKSDLLATLETSLREQEKEYIRRRDEQAADLDAEVEKYRKELDEARRISEGDREKIARLERLLSRMTGAETLFKSIQKKYDPSIVLIYSEFKVRNDKGEERLIGGFGTGFIVTDEGHIITNKHVVEPWKFPQFAFRMKENGETLAAGDPFIAAWLAGKQVYTVEGGKTLLNLSSGYDSRGGKNLKLVRTAPDVMRWVTPPEGEKTAVEKVWAHEPADNNDLALLKITDKSKVFVPLPLMSEDDFGKLEKLDRVMVLGFPRGGSILERGVAETSPALGHIRKVERTIHISAPITQGNSGGPVFAQTGEVVGISTRMIKDVETYGLCIPVSDARKLIADGK